MTGSPISLFDFYTQWLHMKVINGGVGEEITCADLGWGVKYEIRSMQSPTHWQL